MLSVLFYFGQFDCIGIIITTTTPKGGGSEGRGAQTQKKCAPKGGALKGGAKISHFSPFPPQFSFFLFSWWLLGRISAKILGPPPLPGHLPGALRGATFPNMDWPRLDWPEWLPPGGREGAGRQRPVQETA